MKLKNKILTTLAACLFSYSVANAQTSDSSFNKATWYGGISYYNYHEVVNGHDPFMKLESNIPNLTIGYQDESAIRSHNKTDNKFSYYGQASYGTVNYSQWTGVLAHTHDQYTAQTEGYYALPNSFYVGLGYRYLDDKLDQCCAAGYDRKQHYIYLPVGYMADLDGSNLQLQFNYLIKGYNHSGPSADRSVPSLHFHQNSGYGLATSYVPKSYPNFEIFADYWEIKNSNIVSGYLEPHNYTYDIGVKYAF